MFAATVAVAAVCAVFACGAIYQWHGARRDARRVLAPGRLVAINVPSPSSPSSAAAGDSSRRLHLHCLGDGGVTVVFEAGLAASSLNFRALQEQVAGFARACAYDRAGYGWSDRAHGTRTARTAAADLQALLQAADVRPPYVIVAHSFGTYVARVFSAAHASDVAGLLLLDPITAEEWVAPDREHRHLLRGGRVVSNLGAGLAAIGVVRFLLNRLMPADAGRAEGDLRPGSALPGAVLNLLGPNVVVAVRRIVGEVTKMPRTLWPEVQAHWSRASCFLAMAQHFRALSPSAAEVLAVTPERPAAATGAATTRPPLGDIPLVVISAANCSEERVQRQRGLASLSSRGTHLRAATGGHWIHLDEPSLVLDAIRRLAIGGRPS